MASRPLSTCAFVAEIANAETRFPLVSSLGQSKEWDRQNCRLYYSLLGEDRYHSSARPSSRPHTHERARIANIGHCQGNREAHGYPMHGNHGGDVAQR